ncbi:hypothetical protein CTAYLR_010626 [Chrysophaeum taylorii]|uniref:VWFA domain-containing protein n=1 Tax=Chrysophaeum taylorii TaxID=2483200 RepID=A0AAD7UDD0_9STRA|nr:hypothetical protein CTAYLR_010626 [Chrysophaeum taylorii]
MPLEATMVCLDTSEFMRNGDFIPTRHESQQDAANLVVGAKMQQNAENSVGVLTMASVGRRGGARVLVSPTDDMGKILASLHEASIAGRLNLVEGVQVAQLALKHRRNKNGGQRIVLFVGSPVDADANALVKAGKMLKKNNIAVDVVLLGSDDDTADKLRQFVEAAKSNDNSNLVQVPPGVVPSDVLISSPVIQPDAGTPGVSAAGATDAPGAFGGVDANLDPELAMALRVSMEEERARQQAAAAADEAKQQQPAAEATEQPAATPMDADAATDAATAAAETTTAAASTTPAEPMVDDEDALLQQALAMSMREHVASQEAKSVPVEDVAPVPDDKPAEMQLDDDDDDETMQLALQMSMQAQDAAPPGTDPAPAEQAAPPPTTAEPAPAVAESAQAATPAFYDPTFVNQMLSQLPGVDPNDPAIKAALESIRGGPSPDADAPAPAPQDNQDPEETE